MSPEERAAVINARAATAIVRALGMFSENMQRRLNGDSIAYPEASFDAVIFEEGIHWNAIHSLLSA